MTIELYREFFYVTVGVVLLIAAAIIFFIVASKRATNNLTTYALHLNSFIDVRIQDMLDDFCEECKTQYLVMHPKLAEIDFIKSEKEKEMQTDILTLVMTRISPALLDKLSLYYNSAVLTDIIAEKVVILVTAYVVEHNAIKE